VARSELMAEKITEMHTNTPTLYTDYRPMNESKLSFIKWGVLSQGFHVKRKSVLQKKYHGDTFLKAKTSKAKSKKSITVILFIKSKRSKENYD
jgi:hypothetical protein